MEFHWPTVCDFKFKVSNSNQRSFESELIGFDSSKCRCLRIDVTFTYNLRFGSFEKESHVSPTILNFLPAIYLTFAWFHEVEVAFPWQGETVPPLLICPVPIIRYKCATCIEIRVESRGVDQQYPYFSILRKIRECCTIIWITLSPFPSFSME